MHLDPLRHPRTARYLARLPHGLDSHPGCRAKIEAHLSLRPVLSQVASDLPEPMRRFVDEAAPEGWFPEVLGNALILVARDLMASSDEAFFRMVRHDTAALMERPVNRMLMRSFSTPLAVLGAERRWSAFHEGSDLVPEPVRRQQGRDLARIRLRYPTGLFEDPFLVSHFGVVFETVLRGTHAQDVEVRCEAFDAREARYLLSWDAR